MASATPFSVQLVQAMRDPIGGIAGADETDQGRTIETTPFAKLYSTHETRDASPSRIEQAL